MESLEFGGSFFGTKHSHGKTMSEKFTATVTTGIDACTTVLVVGDKGSPDSGVMGDDEKSSSTRA